MHRWTIAGSLSALVALSCSSPAAPPAAPAAAPVVELDPADRAKTGTDDPSTDTNEAAAGLGRGRSEIDELLNVVAQCPACARPQRDEGDLASVAFEEDHYARQVVLRRSGDVRLSCRGPILARGERAEIFEWLTLPVAVETPEGCTHVLAIESGSLLRVVVDSSDLRVVPTDLVRLGPAPSTSPAAPEHGDDPLSGVWLWPGTRVRLTKVGDELRATGEAQGIEFVGYADARRFGNVFTPLRAKQLPETNSFIEGNVAVRLTPTGPVIATVRVARWPVPVVRLGEKVTVAGSPGETWLRVLIHEPLTTTPRVSVIGYIPERSLVERSDAALFAGGLAAVRTPTPSGSQLVRLPANTLLFSEAGVLSGKVLYDTDFVLLPDGRVELPTRWGKIALSPR